MRCPVKAKKTVRPCYISQIIFLTLIMDETEDTLLPLHRSFTDKELINWNTKQIADLKQKLEEIESKNSILQSKNQELRKELKEFDLQFGSTAGGSKTVSARAYNRLMDKFRTLTQTFWEVHSELMALKDKDKENL